MTDLLKLADYFPPTEIEWRVGQAGKRDDGVWAKVLAYVTNRAIQQRLDDVCGPAGWRNEFKPLPTGEKDSTILCGISIKCGEEWVTKWDGMGAMEGTAGLSEQDAAKGTLSGAMKRAAYQWGIGRYLYDLPEGWATCTLTKVRDAHYQPANKAKDIPAFYWTPPELPKWALPTVTEKEDTKRNGSPPVMGPTPTIVSFSGLSILHEPNPSGKQYWKIQGDTTHYGDRLRAMGFKQTKQSKTFYTESEELATRLTGLLAAPLGPLEEMPLALQGASDGRD